MKDYTDIYRNKVDGLVSYIKNNNIKSMVLGISGGIDSTLTALIGKTVANIANVPLIGISMPSTTNGLDENDIAHDVGYAFCTKFIVHGLMDHQLIMETKHLASRLGFEETNSVAIGNVKARLRMIHLYNIAQLTNGIVLDTDNMTEHELGFFTIHGDEGDVGVLRDLYKSEVYEFSEWCLNNLSLNKNEREALEESMQLLPTDGNGVGDDLSQFGCDNYDTVDGILQHNIDEPVGSRVSYLNRRSWFKRIPRPMFINVNGQLCAANNTIIEL